MADPSSAPQCSVCGAALSSASDPCARCAVTRERGESAPATLADEFSLPAAAAPAPSLPRRFGRYLLEQSLGAGGMGVVWKARDTDLGRAIALKLIRADQLGDADAVQRFEREARLAARLRHPAIVAVHDVGECDGQRFLTMDFVPGRTLAAALAEAREGVPAPGIASLGGLARRVEILAAIAEAVEHAHRQGVIHRDLKPGNVMLDAAGRPVVMDFGLAKELADGAGESEAARALTRSGRPLGTPAYMSPEQAAGELAAIGPRSDVWSLGVILFEMLTGTTPFASAGSPWAVVAAVLDRDPPPPRSLDPAAPVELEAVCLRALTREPSRRLESAGVFAEELRRWLAGDPVQSRPVSRRERAARWLRRHRWPVTAAFLLVPALAAALVWGTRDLPERELLAQAAAATSDLEDRFRSVEMSGEARRAAARQAFDVLDAAIRRRPESGPAWSWRGKAHALLDETAAAERDLDEGVRRSPESAVVWFLRGTRRLESYASARGFPPAHQDDAGIRFATPRPETGTEQELRTGGLDDLRRSLQASVADPLADRSAVRLGTAVAALYEGKVDGAERALQAAEGLAGPRAALVRGEADYRLGRFEAAVRELDAAIAVWPRYALVHLLRAQARYALGLALSASAADPRAVLTAACVDLETVLRLDPGCSQQVLLTRALCRMALGSVAGRFGETPDALFAQAAANLDAVIAAEDTPLHRSVRGSLFAQAASLLQARRLDPRDACRRALADFDAAIAQAPLPEYRTARGSTLRILAMDRHARGEDPSEDYRRSLADFTEALRLAPGDPEALLRRGMTEREFGSAQVERGREGRPHFDAALKDFSAVFNRDPSIPMARVESGLTRRAIARLEAQAGKNPLPLLEAAGKDFDEVLRRCPNFGSALLGRGMLRAELAGYDPLFGRDPLPRLQAAATDLDGALHDVPGHPPIRLERGKVHFVIGNLLVAHGEAPEDSWRLAESDLCAARDARLPGAGLLLAGLYRAEGRLADAVAALETETARPATADSGVQAMLEETRALREAATEGNGNAFAPWAQEAFRAVLSVHAGECALARERVRRALELLARARASMSEAERTHRDALPGMRWALLVLHQNGAAACATLSAGRTAAVQPPGSVSPPAREAAAALRDEAFDHLDAARVAGLHGTAWVNGERMLAPLRDDPRWAPFVEKLGR